MHTPTGSICISAVIFRDNRQEGLLHLRGDIWLWSLPGRMVELGEDWEAAAIREVREETVHAVDLDQLVSEYSNRRLVTPNATSQESSLRHAAALSTRSHEACQVSGRPPRPHRHTGGWPVAANPASRWRTT